MLYYFRFCHVSFFCYIDSFSFYNKISDSMDELGLVGVDAVSLVVMILKSGIMTEAKEPIAHIGRQTSIKGRSLRGKRRCS